MPHHTSLIALLCVGFVMAFALCSLSCWACWPSG
jgi:hypothetical protein